MIHAYRRDGDGLAATEDVAAALWIDLDAPAPEEIASVAAATGLRLPDRAEMTEIEHSSRVYRVGDARVMTVLLPTRSADGTATVGPVAFVLGPERLVTLRYHEPQAFETYPVRAAGAAVGCSGPQAVMHGLLDAIIDRLADILETIGAETDAISRTIFRREPGRTRDLDAVLSRIGREGDQLGDIRMSLTTVERVLGFLGQTDDEAGRREFRRILRTQSGDLRSLTEHAGFLGHKIALALDATLGMISIEQNGTIKIFTVVAVIFMPPTLIASIYGMNFAVMPETGWTLGYPFALALMVASAVGTLLVFRRKGWLR